MILEIGRSWKLEIGSYFRYHIQDDHLNISGFLYLQRDLGSWSFVPTATTPCGYQLPVMVDSSETHGQLTSLMARSLAGRYTTSDREAGLRQLMAQICWTLQGK